MSRFVLVVLALICTSAAACSCLPQTFAQHINNADHVLRVKVVWTFTLGFSRYYIAQVQEIYKSPNSGAATIKCQNYILLKTSISSAACGVTLTVGDIYLITGYGINNLWILPVVNINLCGLQRKFCTIQDCDLKELSAQFPRTSCGCVCPLIFRPVCAECGQRRRTFGNQCEADCAGYTTVYQGKCLDCRQRCNQGPQLFCFWGTPRCCDDGTWRCPSGGIPSNPTTWVYNCKPCGELADPVVFTDEVLKLQEQYSAADIKDPTDEQGFFSVAVTDPAASTVEASATASDSSALVAIVVGVSAFAGLMAVVAVVVLVRRRRRRQAAMPQEPAVAL